VPLIPWSRRFARQQNPEQSLAHPSEEQEIIDLTKLAIVQLTVHVTSFVKNFGLYAFSQYFLHHFLV
jgi:hypothetical protein